MKRQKSAMLDGVDLRNSLQRQIKIPQRQAQGLSSGELLQPNAPLATSVMETLRAQKKTKQKYRPEEGKCRHALPECPNFWRLWATLEEELSWATFNTL